MVSEELYNRFTEQLRTIQNAKNDGYETIFSVGDKFLYMQKDAIK